MEDILRTYQKIYGIIVFQLLNFLFTFILGRITFHFTGGRYISGTDTYYIVLLI